MITVNELFSGIGTQSLAFKYLGIPHKVVGIAEISVPAIKAYEVLHGPTRNYGDVSEIEKLDYADFWTYSFPCFTGDTLVLTNSGYKKMIDVNTEDCVYTHKGRFKPVLKKFDNGIHEIWEVKTSNVDVIRTTKNHKFYVVTRSKKWNNSLCKYDYIYSEPYWKECFELTKNDYVLAPTYTVEEEFEYSGYNNTSKQGIEYNINKLQPIINKPEFFWLLGKYIGDGCLGSLKKNRPSGSAVIICSSKKNLEHIEIEKKLKKLKLNYVKKEQRTIYRYQISSVELYALCEKFGKGALNKRIPIEFLNLEKSLLKSFIEGYIFADGCKINNNYKITSVSRELLYGIGLCVTKCYNVPFRLYKNKMPKTTIIEGRVVNQNDFYQLVFNLQKDIKRTGSVYLHGNYWYAVREVKNTLEQEQVYDIEVKDDNSLVVQGLGLHNCQDLSAGGKGAGMKEGTRSGLLWQVERLLEQAHKDNELPKFLLLENVPDINNRRHKPDFDKWLSKLEELGYNNNYGVLSGIEFGVPQLRERMFVISTRKDLDREIIFTLDLEKVPNRGFTPYVEDWVNEYKGPLMVDPTISPAVRANFERDLEEISKSDKNIFSCECKSGFQDNQVGIEYAPTIRHQNTHTAIFHNNQVHKLTAREAWRFMGIKDEDYLRVEDETGLGKTALYGLAGNAIIVDVLMGIYKAMFIKGIDY